jgi:hypothetical protein
MCRALHARAEVRRNIPSFVRWITSEVLADELSRLPSGSLHASSWCFDERQTHVFSAEKFYALKINCWPNVVNAHSPVVMTLHFP